MTFKPAVWYPIATVLSVVNVAAVWFAATAAEPLHATVHAALALGFGLWAQRLRPARRGGDIQTQLEPLELEVGDLRRELMETQERLDFAERVLAQGRDPRRVSQDDQGHAP
jgi:hypothetical protein